MKVRICNQEGCYRKHKGGGLCDSHLTQRKRGKQLTPIRPKGVGHSKTCRQCGETKERTDFRNNGGRNAVKPFCRECERKNYKQATETLADSRTQLL